MNRDEFITELKRRLKKLAPEDLEQAIYYYVEYFEDANISDDVDVTKEFGTPAKIASEILVDYALKQPENKKPIFKSIGFIMLAILAAPIGLPLALAGVILLFIPVIIIISLAFAFIVTALALIGAGVHSIFIGLAVMSQSVPTTLLVGGVGFIVIGLGLLFGLLVIFLTKGSVQLLAKGVKYTLNRLNHRNA